MNRSSTTHHASLRSHLLRASAAVVLILLNGCGNLSQPGYTSRIQRLLEISSALGGMNVGGDDVKPAAETNPEAAPASAPVDEQPHTTQDAYQMTDAANGHPVAN